MSTLLLEIAIIVFFALIGSVLAIRFKQIPLLGLIAVGALIGPFAFGFVQDLDLIDIIIDIGAILLLFTIGIEHDLEKLKKIGIKPVLIALFKIGFVFFFCYEAAILFNMSILTATIIGLLLSFTSTVVFVRILNIKGLEQREEYPLLIGVLIVEDVLAIFLLTFISGLTTTAVTPLNIFFQLVVSLFLLIFIYFFLSTFLEPIVKWVTQYKTRDTFTFFALVLCFGLSYVSVLFDVSPTIGAFLAGSLVARFQQKKEFEAEIVPFSLTFSSLFFLSIGMLINYSVLFDQWFLILIFLIISLIAKFIGTSISMFLFHKKEGTSAVFGGLALLSLGEFSLLLAKEATPLISEQINLLGITSGIIFLSVIANAYSIPYTEKINTFVRKHMPEHALAILNNAAAYISQFIAAFQPEGKLIQASKKKIAILFRSSLFLLGLVFIALLLAKYKLKIVSIPFGVYVLYAAYGIIILIILVLLFRLIKEAVTFLHELAKALVNEGMHPHLEKRLVRTCIGGFFFIIIGFLIPSFISVLSLPKILQHTSLFFFIIGILYFWRTGTLAGDVVKKITKKKSQG